jgi:type VI secretion system protein
VSERCLLERLVRGVASSATSTVDAGAAIDSVVRNLRRLFNARQGCSVVRPDLGMPDFGDMTFGVADTLPQIIRSVKTLIEQFEPRLRGVQVRHDIDEDDPQTIRFAIRAELVVADSTTPIRFAGVLGGDGHIDVRV